MKQDSTELLKDDKNKTTKKRRNSQLETIKK